MTSPRCQIAERSCTTWIFGSGRVSQGPVAALLFNLDRLKPINDYLGHAAGDQFIRDFATRTTEAMQGQGLIARLGGDKFVVVPESAMELRIRDSARRAPERAGDRQRRHRWRGPQPDRQRRCRDRYAGHRLERWICCGTPRKRCLSVKEPGADRIGVFSAEILTRRELRNDIELHLQAGIETGDLIVFFLPEVEHADGKGLGGRGAGALAPSHSRAAVTGGIRSGGRIDQPRRRTRRLGIARGVRPPGRSGGPAG